MRYLFSILVSLTITSSIAQETGKVSGVVYDAITKETLISAAVLTGPVSGTSTDFDGNYSLDLAYGTHTLKVSYVGFEPQEKTITVDRKSIKVDFALSTIQMQEAEILADVAIERETPVAFSNIKPLQIQEELGSQPIPMILNSTPGVYATTDGSDGSGPSITIRGFKQRNVSIMVDGIPVNDMENGRVFWSNWFGLDMVTQTMQVQRGLGASKLALPAIGGTVNVLTQGIESSRKTRVKQEVTSYGRLRTSLGHTTGRTEEGWGFTLAGSYVTDNGYFENTYSDSWFYYFKAQKELGKHVVSLTVTGSPSENGTRSYRQRIVTFSKDYARSLFSGSDEEYANLSGYNQGYVDIKNENLNAEEEATAMAELNNEYGYGSVDDFLLEQGATNFIDTVGLIEKGPKYNVHWGVANGEDIYERQNSYHKPLMSLRDSWRINDKLYWANTIYASVGVGGGSRLAPTLGAGDYDDDLQVNFQKFWDANTIGGLFGPPIDPNYSETELKSTKILRKLFNNHYWIGGLSTFKYDHSDSFALSGGLDIRSYRGEHYAEVFHLLGGDYFVNTDNANEATDAENVKRVGDKIDFHNDSFVRWGGIFLLGEWKREVWNAFVNVSAVYQGYNRVDYFLPKDDDGNFQESGWIWKPGYTFKGGGNYKLNEFNNVFVNVGHLNRTPVFRDVVDFGNRLIENTQNEVINSTEFGFSHSQGSFSFNVNGYFTDWNNRPLDDKLSVELPNGDRVSANLSAMSAVHMGFEVDGAYRFNQNVTLEGFVSIGDWRWDSSADSLILLNAETGLPYIDANTGLPAVVFYDAHGVSVGDAPQTQLGGSLKIDIKDGYIKPRYTLFARHYTEFDPFTLNGDNSGRQSWVIPTYGLLDVHAGYGFDLKKTRIDLRLSVYNVLNSIYVSSALNNEGFSDYYYRDTDRIHPDKLVTNFDAAAAGVFLGRGLNSNFSLSVRF